MSQSSLSRPAVWCAKQQTERPSAALFFLPQSSLWSSTEGVSVGAQGWSHCVLSEAAQQLAEQAAVLCCHIIRTRDTDFPEAICLCLYVFPLPTVDLFKLRGVPALTGWLYMLGVTEKVTQTLTITCTAITPSSPSVLLLDYCVSVFISLSIILPPAIC